MMVARILSPVFIKYVRVELDCAKHSESLQIDILVFCYLLFCQTNVYVHPDYC